MVKFAKFSKFVKVEFVKNFSKKICSVLNIFSLTAFFVASCISIFSIKPRNSNLRCLLENDEIESFVGTVVSNPTLTSKKTFYRCKVNVIRSCGKNKNGNFIDSSASGDVFVLIPKQIVESHYPKRLYSVCKNPNANDIIVETGSKLELKVTCIDKNEKLFSVEQVNFLGWKNKIAYFRANCRLNFKRLLSLWGEAGGFVLALLASSREYTDEKIADAFRLAGLSHILALSGMHVGIFSGFAKKLFLPFAGEKITDCLSLLAVSLFVWFAGFSPSLTRALIGCFLAYFANIFCIKSSSLTMLSISFLIQILIFPSDFASISFMLSYLALLGIILFSEFFSRFLCRFTGTFFANQLSPSISAIIMTSPLSAKIFGFITPIGVFSSMIISPLVTYFLILSLIFIILCLILPFLSVPLGTIVQIMYYVIKNIGIFFAKFPPIRI